MIKTCKKCGGTDFNPSGGCRACKKAYVIANIEKIRANYAVWCSKNRNKLLAYDAHFRKTFPDKVKAKKAKYRSSNLEKVKAGIAAWKSENRERVKNLNAVWRAANPHINKIKSQKRRALSKSSGGSLSKGLVEKLIKLQQGKCPCCQQPLGDDYHLDHITPFARGGANTDDNIQLLRAGCNQKKHARDPIEFMQSRGFLI
jgi:5-methylcytosine-specific restriction endonuclease McrA